jgi:hypothetical protein
LHVPHLVVRHQALGLAIHQRLALHPRHNPVDAVVNLLVGHSLQLTAQQSGSHRATRGAVAGRGRVRRGSRQACSGSSTLPWAARCCVSAFQHSLGPAASRGAHGCQPPPPLPPTGRPRRPVRMAASFSRLLRSAPEKPGVRSATSLRSTWRAAAACQRLCSHVAHRAAPDYTPVAGSCSEFVLWTTNRKAMHPPPAHTPG